MKQYRLTWIYTGSDPLPTDIWHQTPRGREASTLNSDLNHLYWVRDGQERLFLNEVTLEISEEPTTQGEFT